MPIEFKKQEDMEAFLPSEEWIRVMHQRYPVHSAFIQDMMLTPNSAAGWFIAGYIFGIDPELRAEFDPTFHLVGAKGVQRTMYDA